MHSAAGFFYVLSKNNGVVPPQLGCAGPNLREKGEFLPEKNNPTFFNKAKGPEISAAIFTRKRPTPTTSPKLTRSLSLSRTKYDGQLGKMKGKKTTKSEQLSRHRRKAPFVNERVADGRRRRRPWENLPLFAVEKTTFNLLLVSFCVLDDFFPLIP